MSKTALIAVDVQGDFIGGSLGGQTAVGIAARRAVIAPLLRLARMADLVVASRDWHPADHCSFDPEPRFVDGSWPAHCVQGTPGAAIAPQILAAASVVASKGTDSTREAYSAFDADDVDLASLLRAKDVRRVTVGGLCTDYCVKATVLDAIKHGFETEVALNACCGVDPSSSAEAIKQMQRAGAIIVPSRTRR